MANTEKVADAQMPEEQKVGLQPEAEKLELIKDQNESVELSEAELANVAGAGPTRSDDG